MTEEILQRFFRKKLIQKQTTKKTWTCHLHTYFRIIGKDMDTYFTSGFTPEDYQDDLERVWEHFGAIKKPMLSRRNYFTAVKAFLIWGDKRLKDLEFWEELGKRVKGAEPSTEESPFNRDQLRDVLIHGDIRAKALFLVACSSGKRIGELLAITMNDLHLDDDVAWISITKNVEDSLQTKTGMKGRALISDEARNYLREYLKVRDAYVERSTHKMFYHKRDNGDNLVFPFSYKTARQMFLTMLMNSGKVKTKMVHKKSEDHRRTVVDTAQYGTRIDRHIHQFRAFTCTYLGDSYFADFIVGHKNPMTRAYFKMPWEDLCKKYRQLMPNVTIFESTPDLSGITEDLKMKESRIAELEATLNAKDQDFERMLSTLIQRVEMLESSKGRR